MLKLCKISGQQLWDQLPHGWQLLSKCAELHCSSGAVPVCHWNSPVPFAAYQYWKLSLEISFFYTSLEKVILERQILCTFPPSFRSAFYSKKNKLFFLLFPFLDPLPMGTDCQDEKHNGRCMSITLFELKRLLDLNEFSDVITAGAKQNKKSFRFLANSVIWNVVFHAGLALILEICQKGTVDELDDLELISVKARRPDGGQSAKVVWIVLCCVHVHCTWIILWMWAVVVEVISTNVSALYGCSRVIKSDRILWGMYINTS